MTSLFPAPAKRPFARRTAGRLSGPCMIVAALAAFAPLTALAPLEAAAEGVSIEVRAPGAKVLLLNADGSLNQTPTLCEESQAFSGYLPPEDAAVIAESRCRLRLLEGAAYNIQASPLLKTLQIGQEAAPDFLSLAESLARTQMLGETQPAVAEGSNQVQVQVELSALYPDFPAALKAGVAEHDFQYLLGLALSLEKETLAQVETALPKLAAGSTNLQAGTIRPEVNRLKALRLCRQLLAPAKDSASPAPAQQTERAEHNMNQAARLDPANPLVFHLLGENQLKSGRSAQAVASFTHALKLKPDFPPALLSRGSAYLRLNLIDLALADFDRAVALSPENPSYYMARASAWLIREDFPAMCRDFRSACSKGECDGYHWATSRGHCE